MQKSKKQGKRKKPEQNSGFELELKRQLFHAAAGILTVLILVSFSRTVSVIYLGGVLVSLIVLTIYRENRPSIHSNSGIKGMYGFESWLERRVLQLERPGELALRGALFFFMSSFIVFEFFPLKIAIASILVLAIADAASTLIGKTWGVHKLPVNRDKSWEGSVAFFVAATATLSMFMYPTSAALVALAAMLVEMIPKVDDNLTVPAAIALIISLLKLV